MYLELRCFDLWFWQDICIWQSHYSIQFISPTNTTKCGIAILFALQFLCNLLHKFYVIYPTNTNTLLRISSVNFTTNQCNYMIFRSINLNGRFCIIFAYKKVIDLVGESPHSPKFIEKSMKENYGFQNQTTYLL